MTSGMVGSARVEITGDIGVFARETEAKIKGLMRDVGQTVDSEMRGVNEKFARGGKQSGEKFTSEAKSGLRSGGGVAGAVKSEASTAEREGKTAFGRAGHESGAKFMESARETMKGMGGAIFAGVGALGVAEVAKKSIEAADELEAANIKVEGSFGESGKSVQTWAKSMASSLGLSQAQAENAAGTFGQMLHAMGIGQEQAAGMSEKMSELTQNVAKFNNADPAAVQSAFVAAMRGRGKALMALGINLDSTTIAAEAMRHGIVKMNVDQAKVAAAQDTLNKAVQAQQKIDKDTTKTAADRKAATDKVATAEDALKAAMGGKLPVLTQSQKGLASYYAILDGTRNQADAVAKSDHTLAQQKKILGAEVQNLEAKVGTLLLPVLTKLAEMVTRDVIPAIAAFGHWVAQNKAWIEPLAATLAGLAAAYVTVRLAMGAYHKVMDAGRAIHSAYNTAAGIARSAAEKLGLVQRREATTTATTTEEQNAATQTSNAETATSRGTMASEMAVADEKIVAGAEATSASVIEANTAIIASNREVAASRMGGGGVPGMAGKAAGAGESAVAGEAGVAGRAAMAGEGAVIGGEAAVAGEGIAAGGAAAEGGMMAAVAPLALVAAGVIGVGLAVNKLTGDDAKWAKMKQNMSDLFGKGMQANVKNFGDAIQQDGNHLGQTAETMIMTQAQGNGLADSFGKAGISLADMTRGIVGNDTQFKTMMNGWIASQHPSHDLVMKLGEMRIGYEKGKQQAQQLTDKQLALNYALNSMKPPEPLHLKVIDDASKGIGVIKNELLGLDGRVVRTFVEVDAIGKGAGYMQQGGSRASTGFGLASGGVMPDGYGWVGEEGPERVFKRGNFVRVMPTEHRPPMAPTHTGSTASGISEQQLAALIEAINNRPIEAQLVVDRKVLASASNEGNMRNARR